MQNSNMPTPDDRQAELIRQSNEIQKWMQAHWNQDSTEAYREQRRRYMAIIDELNIITQTQNPSL